MIVNIKENYTKQLKWLLEIGYHVKALVATTKINDKFIKDYLESNDIVDGNISINRNVTNAITTIYAFIKIDKKDINRICKVNIGVTENSIKVIFEPPIGELIDKVFEFEKAKTILMLQLEVANWIIDNIINSIKTTHKL